ncbi:gamete expressed protein 1 [Actinidia rufa]|uniref:Gamete expressed protein 1 n=1 Tax=Actinidia rufa TaxID=165716 RepID=A0A7J0EMB0_9ERIC|nr:gamete expressed protein 1 [Actinidia rufa]
MRKGICLPGVRRFWPVRRSGLGSHGISAIAFRKTPAGLVFPTVTRNLTCSDALLNWMRILGRFISSFISRPTPSATSYINPPPLLPPPLRHCRPCSTIHPHHPRAGMVARAGLVWCDGQQWRADRRWRHVVAGVGLGLGRPKIGTILGYQRCTEEKLDFELENNRMLLKMYEHFMDQFNGMRPKEEVLLDTESDMNWSSLVVTELPEDVDKFEDPDYMLPEEIGENSVATTSSTRRYNLCSRHYHP